jgi:hypothetical protein
MRETRNATTPAAPIQCSDQVVEEDPRYIRCTRLVGYHCSASIGG